MRSTLFMSNSHWIGGPAKAKAVLLIALLVAANLAVWLLALFAGHRYALLLSQGILAYGFGLRHAVDADHISAIDNTTRKLMREGKRPLGVGFFFSLGHSTVVFLLCAALALSTAYVQRHLPQWQSFGAVAGTLISGLFLYGIGIVNLVVLWDVVRTYRRSMRGEPVDEGDGLQLTGLMGRILRPMLRLIEKSWQMYIVGFLFGLGFDTATEVGILAMSARSGQSNTPFWAIMLLPVLFTVGMCLVDTLDGILMLGAYGWAAIEPKRKLLYNLVLTVVTVLIAFVVGTYEMLQIIQSQLALKGAFWAWVSRVNFDQLGFVIIGAFLAAWGVSALIYRWRNTRLADADRAL